jgi:hypothetical protein
MAERTSYRTTTKDGRVWVAKEDADAIRRDAERLREALTAIVRDSPDAETWSRDKAREALDDA